VRLLFLKHSLYAPRTRGHDVHTFEMIRALETLGHHTHLFTIERPTPAALDGLSATPVVAEDLAEAAGGPVLGRLQERFRSYWGVDRSAIDRFSRLTRELAPDAVIGAGLDVLPYLAAVKGPTRAWYAADDLAWQHLTQFRPRTPASWGNLRSAAIGALYERAFAGAVDQTWVVSENDARAIRWLGGARQVAVIPNGVDTGHFRPLDAAERPATAIFWGHLGFPPNVRAVEWLCTNVWPLVRRREPAAVLTIAGIGAGQEVRRLSGRDGIDVVGALPDLRPAIAEHALAVMPFLSGSGLKNKMLESAAMGRATLCSKAALNGLRGDSRAAFVLCDTPDEWVDAMVRLWAAPGQRARIGAGARAWVEGNHTWRRAAQEAEVSLRRR
jgi:glycosyltransferase involved in cell wall biosynthesis